MSDRWTAPLRRITGARIDGHPGLVDIEIDDGRVGALVPHAEAAPMIGDLAVHGSVVVPGFVDAHVHLDKAYMAAGERAAPTLHAAIAAVEHHRRASTLDEVESHARRALDTLVRNGVVAARAHVEIGPGTAEDLVDLHLRLAEEESDRCSLDLVAFPQHGLGDSSTIRRMDAALRKGLAVVGGCPYADREPVRHLDLVFEMAERHGAPIDLHLDFSDDVESSLVDLVVERTIATGMQGRVAIGHVTTLASMTRMDQQRILERLALAGIGLIVLPATDLYLGGHGEPGTRSLAPVERAAAAGAVIAIANNNLANPFSPYGNGSPLHAAWLTGLIRRIGDDALLMRAITSWPSTILGRPPHGPFIGSSADLVVVDADDPVRVVAQCPAVMAVVHRGRLVHSAPRVTGDAGLEASST